MSIVNNINNAKKNNKLQINMGDSYKLGMNEVVGLEQAIREVFQPVVKHLQTKVYWNTLELEQVEYKSRDGFIPHSHNCGGLKLAFYIPKYEQHEFGFLEFDECEGCN